MQFRRRMLLGLYGGAGLAAIGASVGAFAAPAPRPGAIPGDAFVPVGGRPRVVVPSGPNDGRTRELMIEFATGADDLRGGNDNLDLIIHVRRAPWQEMNNVNAGRRWADRTRQRVRVPLKESVPVCDLTDLVLLITSRGGFGADEWKLDSLKVTAVGGGTTRVLYSSSGNPLHHFAGGERRGFAVPLRC